MLLFRRAVQAKGLQSAQESEARESLNVTRAGEQATGPLFHAIRLALSVSNSCWAIRHGRGRGRRENNMASGGGLQEMGYTVMAYDLRVPGFAGVFSFVCWFVDDTYLLYCELLGKAIASSSRRHWKPAQHIPRAARLLLCTAEFAIKSTGVQCQKKIMNAFTPIQHLLRPGGIEVHYLYSYFAPFAMHFSRQDE